MIDSSGDAAPAEYSVERHAVSRRSLLLGSGVGVIGLAAGAATSWDAVAAAAVEPHNVAPRSSVAKSSYVTEPSLNPPQLQVTNLGASASDGLILLTPVLLPTLAPLTEGEAVADHKGLPGLLITDVNGNPIYIQHEKDSVTNLQVQEYRGEPVLTYWKGVNKAAGIGAGTCTILNSAYESIAEIKASGKALIDAHEFVITPENTALVTVYNAVKKNLTSVGGPVDGVALDSMVQEIDIATGALLYEWHSLEHVPVTDSYSPYAGGQYDYFHINSIDLWDDDNLIISSRNTWAVYKVNRRTGALIWRLNGKQSDFEMGPGATFEWQHHARRLSTGQVTLFDDAATPPEGPYSRGLVLDVNETSMTASLTQAFSHPARLLAWFEGSMQLQSNGHAVVGYGGEPYMSEFDSDGNLILDVRMPTDMQSYRGFRSAWVGRPKTAPKFYVATDTVGGYAAYASWNGATDIASWRVLAGSAPHALSSLFTVNWAGFETAMTVHTTETYLAVEALNRNGDSLGTSETVKL